MSLPPSPARLRVRALLLALTSLMLVVSTTALVEPAAAKPRKGGSSKVAVADRPWSGFKLRATKKADGGFLGGRVLADGQVVYRIDPGGKARSKAFVPGGTFSDVVTGTGKAPASTTATARAAWIVGKYGAYRDKVQSAAVELALHDLLVGGPWALTGKRTKARLAQLPRRARKDVLEYVATMLAGAEKFASTYDVSMSTTPSTIRGGTSTSSLRVAATGTGAGVPNLQVSFAAPGGSSVVRTDADGRASASFPVTREGANTTTASVANVPENRLLVLTPTTAKASRVVVADRKTDRVLTGTTTGVVARPTLGMFSPDRLVGQNPGAIIDLQGTHPTARTVSATLFGPFTANNGTCTGRVETSGTFTVTGQYQLPPAAPGTSGYYYWDVSIPGNTENAPVRACSGNMRVIASPSARTAPNPLTIDNGRTSVGITYAQGLPPSYAPDGPINIGAFGPYRAGEAVTCASDRLAAVGEVPNRTSDTGVLPDIPSAPMRFQHSRNDIQYYAFVAFFPPDRFGRSNVFTTPCVVADSQQNYNIVGVRP